MAQRLSRWKRSDSIELSLLPPKSSGNHGSHLMACADFSFSGVSHAGALDIIADLGFNGVSLGFFSGLTAITPELIRGRAQYWGGVLAERTESRRLAVADVFGSGSTTEAMSLNHPDPREREAAAQLFRDLVEIALCVGATGLTLLPGVQHDGQSWLESVQLSAAELTWRVADARENGLRLSVEPHAGSHVDTPEKVLQLLQLVPELELTLDYGHFHAQGIPDCEVDPLLEHARHFHCRGGTAGMIQTDFDTNTIDFGRILEAMTRAGYGGWIEIEYIRWARGMGGSDCDNLREAHRFLEFLRTREAGSKG
jgi:sugar phosphate isomerase/epimerase